MLVPDTQDVSNIPLGAFAPLLVCSVQQVGCYLYTLQSGKDFPAVRNKTAFDHVDPVLVGLPIVRGF